jgi:16S rRNA (adenine1518-N6/adenine1519-N6)-dimethyltransferase
MSEQTPLPPFEDPRRVLSRHSLHPKKYMSQNFLVARSVVERIADAAEISADERVVELGPGLGTLTGELLRRGARVVAVEMDREMIEVLHAELDSTGRFEVLHGDAAEFDFGSVATSGPVKVLGNLPYAVTGAILRNLVSQRAVIERAVIMIQREVRDRLVAKPATRDYGALTVFTQAAFDVFKVIDVKPGSFHPPPKVSSAVVRLVPLSPARAEETPAFRAVVKAAFETRRKTLRNALRKVQGIEAVDLALSRTGIDGTRRGETLSVEEFGALSISAEWCK